MPHRMPQLPPSARRRVFRLFSPTTIIACLLRNHQRLLTPARRVADEPRIGMPREIFDGFEFLAILRGLSRHTTVVGIFERLFSSIPSSSQTRGMGRWHRDEPLHFPDVRPRRTGREKSPLPGGLVDGELAATA